MVRIAHSFSALMLGIAMLGFVAPAKADTVKVRCDVVPKGDDRATSSGPCTFLQRRGAVGIQLATGTR